MGKCTLSLFVTNAICSATQLLKLKKRLLLQQRWLRNLSRVWKIGEARILFLWKLNCYTGSTLSPEMKNTVCDGVVWYNCADISEECAALSAGAFSILKLETACYCEVMVNFYELQNITTPKTAQHSSQSLQWEPQVSHFRCFEIKFTFL